MTDIRCPDGLELHPQEWRVFEALHDWADATALARALSRVPGEPAKTHPRVIVSKLKRKLEQFGLSIETRALPSTRRSRKPVEYRIVAISREQAAA